MNWFDSWGLTLVVFLPVVGMAIVLLLPREDEQTVKAVTLLTTIATLGVTVAVLARYKYGAGHPGLQFDVNKSWIEVINSRYHIGVDGISLPMVALSSFISVLCVVYSWNHFPEPHNPKAFLALLLLLETGMNGTFVAQDLILFFIFFELVLLPMFFMIGVWGGPNKEYASIKFFLFTMFGSGADAAELPRALLQGRRERRHARSHAAHVRHPDARRRARRRLGARHRAAHLRRALPRLRDQGADVPVPHLAPRRAHRSADGRLGAAGRDPAEARYLRVHPDRVADPARWRPAAGLRGSACSP